MTEPDIEQFTSKQETILRIEYRALAMLFSTSSDKKDSPPDPTLFGAGKTQ